MLWPREAVVTSHFLDEANGEKDSGKFENKEVWTAVLSVLIL